MVHPPHRPTRRRPAVRLLTSLALLALVLLPLAATDARTVGQRMIKTAPTGAESAGVTWSGPPPAGSKYATAPPATDPAGLTTSGLSAPGSKNYHEPQLASDPAAPEASATGWRFTACGSIPGSDWATTSTAYQPIRSCTLTFSEDGVVYLSGSTSVGVGVDGEYEARFSLGIDSLEGIAGTGRWVNAYTDAGDGTDKTMQITTLAPVSAGTHTFYFLGARQWGVGSVQLYNPNLSVLYFPNSSADIKTCGVGDSTVWTTTSSTFQAIRSCDLVLRGAGFAYISGTASVGGGFAGAYEGSFRVGVDNVNGTSKSSRWVNVYPDGGDGTDETIATSLLTEVTYGLHTFSFSGMRRTGPGSVQLIEPNLSVLYFPTPTATLKVCAANGFGSWSNATATATTIRSCTLNVPRESFAFVDATASASLSASQSTGEWEGQFRLGVDDVNGASTTTRWVNVYPDSDNGTDRSVAQSMLFNVSRGEHTFSFVGWRYAGSATALLYAPSLSVLVPGDRAFLPFIRR